MTSLKIGTRKSKLALWQAQAFRSAVRRVRPDWELEVVKISTSGDKFLKQPLYEIGGKGLFIKELEQALLTKKIDLALHSLKDVPAAISEEFALAPVLQRASPFDAFVSLKHNSINNLSNAAHIGTTSLRRTLQLKLLNPEFRISPLRGNINTRLDKLNRGVFDAVILAAAGLDRMGYDRDFEVLSPDMMLPAVGQGCLAVEYLVERTDITELAQTLSHEATKRTIECERAFLAALGGDCWTPVGGLAQLDGDSIKMRAAVFSPVGEKQIQLQLTGDSSQPVALGRSLAQQLLASGAAEFLKDCQKHYRP